MKTFDEFLSEAKKNALADFYAKIEKLSKEQKVALDRFAEFMNDKKPAGWEDAYKWYAEKSAKAVPYDEVLKIAQDLGLAKGRRVSKLFKDLLMFNRHSQTHLGIINNDYHTEFEESVIAEKITVDEIQSVFDRWDIDPDMVSADFNSFAWKTTKGETISMDIQGRGAVGYIRNETSGNKEFKFRNRVELTNLIYKHGFA